MSTGLVEQKAKELLEALQAERRDPDWEQRMRMFAGNDSRILRRIPLIRRKVAVQKSFAETVKDYLTNLENINTELG